MDCTLVVSLVRKRIFSPFFSLPLYKQQCFYISVSWHTRHGEIDVLQPYAHICIACNCMRWRFRLARKDIRERYPIEEIDWIRHIPEQMSRAYLLFKNNFRNFKIITIILFQWWKQQIRIEICGNESEREKTKFFFFFINIL